MGSQNVIRRSRERGLANQIRAPVLSYAQEAVRGLGSGGGRKGFLHAKCQILALCWRCPGLRAAVQTFRILGPRVLECRDYRNSGTALKVRHAFSLMDSRTVYE
jgi:hypothetical protein